MSGNVAIPAKRLEAALPSHLHHARFAGTSAAVREALEQASERLVLAGASVECRSRLELVLAEVLNNVVEHAYCETSVGLIELKIWSTVDGLACEVEDYGRPMPDGVLPSGKPAVLECLRDDLPEGGFGWLLIRELANELGYRRERGCNRLRFCVTGRPDRDVSTRVS